MSGSHRDNRDDNTRDDADDALSPSDGYFHASDAVSQGSSSDATHRRQSSNVPSIPNVLVEDPTLQQGPGADKAREAQQERILNTAARHTSPAPTSPPPQQSSSQLRFPLAGPSESAQSRQQDQLTSSSSNPSRSPYPVLPNQSDASQHYQDSDAPPAYTPTSPTTTSGYQTFASSNPSSTPQPNVASVATGSPHNMGNPEEQPFLPYHQQGARLPDNNKPPAWQQGQRSSRLRKILKTILGILVVVSIFLAIFGFDFDDAGNIVRPPKFGHKPVKNPVMDNPSFDWRPDSGCYADQRTHQKFEFDVDFVLEKSFNLIQKLEKRGRRWGSFPRVKGDVSILPADKGSAGRAIVELLSNEDESSTDISFSTSRYSSELKIITPESLPWSEKNGGPCIQIRVTLYVPAEALLHRLSIATTQLNIGIQDGIVLGVGESASFETVSGDFWTSPKDGGNDPYELATVKQHVTTVSGNIDGWFSLYDNLELTSVSGDIGVSISPKERKDAHVADLKIESVSGNVEVQEVGFGEKVDDIPKRDYRVNIQTTSGDVKAGLLVGKHAAFETMSGNLEVDVWPILDKSWTSADTKQKLATQTTSGDVNLRVREPVIVTLNQDNKDGDADESHTQDDNALRGLTNLQGTHGSISGNQRLLYPAVWQGKAHASTMSGNVKIHGKGVTVTKKGGFVEKQYNAVKGDGDSWTEIQTISGDVNMQIGSD